MTTTNSQTEQKKLIRELETLVTSLEGIREKIAYELMYLRNSNAPVDERVAQAIKFVEILVK